MCLLIVVPSDNLAFLPFYCHLTGIVVCFEKSRLDLFCGNLSSFICGSPLVVGCISGLHLDTDCVYKVFNVQNGEITFSP